MNRRPSSMQHRSLGATLALVLPLLAGCGSATHGNPFAPTVSPSNQAGTIAVVAKASKHNHANGNGTSHNSQNSPGGVTSGPFPDPGAGEPNEPLVIE